MVKISLVLSFFGDGNSRTACFFGILVECGPSYLRRLILDCRRATRIQLPSGPRHLPSYVHILDAYPANSGIGPRTVTDTI